MNELTFYDFVNNKYLTTTYIINGTLSNYFEFLNNNNIETPNSIFIHNFKIINNKLIIDNTFNNIIILEKNYFEKNKIKSTNNTNNFTLDNKTDEYISLLQNNNDLISFIIILKTDKLDYIISYLEKYKKKPISDIIKSNQQNIIDILTYNNNFIDLYIRTSNINILEYIINYTNNNYIISQLETIFPDVPIENIEELITVFS
tara:strand:+ start:1757 stop:2365 length:609 start_codon:yes stop_codon:yes gene_type:complete